MSASTDSIRSAGLKPLGRPAKSPLARFLTNRWTLRVISLVAVLVLWEHFGRLAPLRASYPTEFTANLWDDFVPQILPAAGNTFGPLAAGFAIAVVAGIIIGVLMAANEWVEVALSPYITAIYATPRIALLPVLILWLGIGFEVRLAIVILSAIFPVILNTYLGCKEVSSSLVDVGRSFNGSRLAISAKIVLRSSLPYVVAGIRIGFGRGLIGIIVAEILTAGAGLGNLIEQDAEYFQIGRMFAVVIVLGIVALAFSAVLRLVESRLAEPSLRRERSTRARKVVTP